MKRAATNPLEPLVEELDEADRKARRRGDPEDWHRLRTTSRRLRGALIAYGKSLGSELHVWLSRRAKRITRVPRKVRDLDVARENLLVLREGATDKAERRAARELRQRLARKRDRWARKARRELRRDDPVAALASVLRKALREAGHGRDAMPPSEEALAKCAREVLDRRAALRGWRDEEPVHKLRIAVKKYRDAVSVLPASHPARTALEDLRRVQQLLGEHHDWSVLGHALAKRAAAARGARQRQAHQALRARADHERQARFETYRRELDDRLPALVRAEAPAHSDRRPPLRAVSGEAASRSESAGSP